TPTGAHEGRVGLGHGWVVTLRHRLVTLGGGVLGGVHGVTHASTLRARSRYATRMQRRRSAAFTIVVTLVMFVGAIGMGVVLLLSGAPGALVVGLVLAAFPVGPLIACYMWLDRYEPEPRSLLVLGLGWGAFVATSGALVLQLFDSVIFETTDNFAATVVAPVTEEAAKGLFILLLLIYRRNELDGVLDGLVYAGMVGIGFAFTENILYLTSAYMGDDGHA